MTDEFAKARKSVRFCGVVRGRFVPGEDFTSGREASQVSHRFRAKGRTRRFRIGDPRDRSESGERLPLTLPVPTCNRYAYTTGA
jgi:hypothetical protein